MPLELNRNLLGSAIRAERISRGLSQEELAEILDITPTHMKHIESGHRMPSVKVLYNAVITLRLSLDALFFSQNSENSELYEELIFLIKQCNDNQLNILCTMVNALLDNK